MSTVNDKLLALDKKDPADSDEPIDADDEWEERKLPVKPKRKPKKKPEPK